MPWLKDYVALVTGGGSGIGRAVIHRFLEEGATGVGVLVRNPDHIADLQQEFGERVVVHAGDVRSYADNLAAVEQTVARWGKLDTLVGNAGLWDYKANLERMTPEQVSDSFDEIFGVNVKGYVLAAKAAAPHLRRSAGSMIFTLSNSAFYADGGGPLYVASKHAGLGLIKQLALDFAPDVRVNGVAPGATMTPLRGLASLGKNERRLQDIHGFEDAITAASPLQFVAQPHEHTGHFVLLASKENSRATTATVIHSDGGWEVRPLR